MTESSFHPDEPRFLAGVDMIRRTGSTEFQIRYDEEQEPVIWMAVACHMVDGSGRPVATGGKAVHSVAADLTPIGAVMRLCEQLVDGGLCAHCHKPSAFDAGFEDSFLDETLCWTQYDPERAMYRRGCE